MTEQQRTLFNPGPATDGLTRRQRTVLQAIGPDGITAEQAGQLVGSSATWAEANGRQILLSLKRRGLVVERRNPSRFELARALQPNRASGDIPY